MVVMPTIFGLRHWVDLHPVSSLADFAQAMLLMMASSRRVPSDFR